MVTCLKVLLVTSSPDQLYRSTDFDVHRNWLALSRHVPLAQWYYDDADGGTVHTLDYPPAFAYFEYLLANNPVTDALRSRGMLDGRCFEVLGDDANDPSDACVAFQRATVSLSDGVLYGAAWFAARAVNPNDVRGAFVSAGLIVTNPALLLLDHVHFQYNAMLLGWLLLSVGCLARGAAAATLQHGKGSAAFRWDLLGAFFYALLLGMKHLYLLLAPLYFAYLLRHCCFVPRATRGDKKAAPPTLTFAIGRFLALALVTGTTLVLPYVPILMATESGQRLEQLLQIFRRLFPYQRGLVHTYWAANVWALYLFADKCIRFALGRVGLASIHLPDVPPSVCSVLLLIALMPAISAAWKGGTAMLRGQLSDDQSASFFVYAAVFSAFSGFMLSYHCHEKAILTVIIPLTLLATQSKRNAQLFLRSSSLGHFGILPLLYRPAELGLKTVAYVSYMALSVWVLKMTCSDETRLTNASRKLTNVWDRTGLLALVLVFVFMELIHPLFLSNVKRLAFLPLLLTSISCAAGMVACWVIALLHLRDATGWNNESKKEA